ncbi:hypothetical protein TSUD_336140, partial [Trifolium subterraneum]
MYSGGGGSSVPHHISSVGGAHRRCHSELVTKGFQRSDSFQKLKARVHKAWGWGGKSREEDFSPTFNPEIMANQKRQWYQLHPKSMDCLNYKEPTSLFEHFVIVGLHPDANLEVVEHAFARRKKWEREQETSERLDYRMTQQQRPSDSTLEPQILFKYPPARRLTVRMKDLASFCFPEGVKASLLERTPSLSELNEIVYGQEHLERDDLSFVFTLKEADNTTLYGVCLHVPEIVQRPPGILGGTSPPLSLRSRLGSRFLVSAPRCYCLLTKVPFFELHFEMLNSLIAQERLNRITKFVNEFTLSGCIPSTPKLDDESSSNTNSPDRESFSDWMTCAIPIDDAAIITAAAAGIIPDDEIPQLSPKIWDSRCYSPVSVSASDASDVGQFRDTCAFEGPETHDSVERIYGNGECGQFSPSVVTPVSARGRSLGSSESILFSPVRSIVSEDEYHHFSNNERDNEDDLSMEWATDCKNDLLQIVCRYHAQAIPPRGSEFVFHPLEHLQAIQYIRHSVVSLGFRENCLDCSDSAEVNAKLVAAEEALALSLMALVTGVLLEKQVVILCPNLGVLSAVVLSIIPMIRPFQWQSLLLPVLPANMIDFLDAPVPFIVGIQHKPDDLNIKTANLVEVNVMKDQVKKCHLPRLPQQRDLLSQLGPIHAKLSRESSISRKQPIHRCNEVQAETATKFLNIMWHYLESLCSNLKSHTITSVQSNHDRVSLLLKDSFIDSFPTRDQPFMKIRSFSPFYQILVYQTLRVATHNPPTS